jgi:uncharacterized phage-associated protein
MQTVDMAMSWDDFDQDEESAEDLRASFAKGTPVVTGRQLSVVDVAEALLERLPHGVDGWKLEKLCYLVQAKHLAQTGLPAFREPVEAWTHGPVVDRLYQVHKHDPRIFTVRGDARSAEKEDTVASVVEQVVAAYGDWSGRQLRELTHSQEPWLEARRGLGPTDRSRRRISPKTMREYFEVLEALPNDDLEDDTYESAL